MSKGKYTHIKAIEQEILGLMADGKTKWAIAEQTGLRQEQIKELLK